MNVRIELIFSKSVSSRFITDRQALGSRGSFLIGAASEDKICKCLL